jgi:hypothetical protein
LLKFLLYPLEMEFKLKPSMRMHLAKKKDRIIGPLYTQLGAGPSTGPIHVQLSLQSGPPL